MVFLHKYRKSNAKAVDLHMVDMGIPCFPLPNSPFKNGQKHSNNSTLHNNSPNPDPCPSSAGGCNLNKIIASVVKCSSKMVVPSTKLGDSSKVNLPASSSLAASLDCSFFVTSKAVSDILKSLNMTLKNPKKHVVMLVILVILWLFHQNRTVWPVRRYSDKVCKL
jgi:hypothetical protein